MQKLERIAVKRQYRAAAGQLQKMTVKESGGTYFLRWVDPADTVVDNQVLCTWAGTMIVRKAGSYPANPYDGQIVLDNQSANSHSFAWLEDTPPADESGYFMRPFRIRQTAHLTLTIATGLVRWFMRSLLIKAMLIQLAA